MDINWIQLRTLHGSQTEAFEELVCQLAHLEPIGVGAQFIRKGRPDAGVECLWRASNGSEQAWQAKFFLGTLGSSQWQQLDDSVRTALNKHPSLAKYIVCIPQDRPDARIGGNKSFLDRWNERCEKWSKWAAEVGMTVSFEYWGNHEILQRLSSNDNAGRYRFWFNRSLFDETWMRWHIESQIANAGPRYTPEAHVDLPIAAAFDWLVRNPSVLHRIVKAIGTFKHRWNICSRHLDMMDPPVNRDQLVSMSNELVAFQRTLPDDSVHPLQPDELWKLAEKTSSEVYKIKDQILKHPDAVGYEKKAQSYDSLAGHKFREQLNALKELASQLYEVKNVLSERGVILADRPCLLILGKAGSGKTHLMCDVAKERLAKGLPTLLLLGEQFSDAPPWPQILEMIGFQGHSAEELLGALDAVAEQCGQRALIMIDALNENKGASLWPKYLYGMLKGIARFPRVAIALSLRHGYQETILGDDQDRWPIHLWHQGFEEALDEACEKYFQHYQIQSPTIPLLHPEFSNPLFLKTFCLAVRNEGLKAIPEGFEGITKILNFFVKSLRKKIWGEQYPEIDPYGAKIRACVEALAAKFAESDLYWINVVDAEAVISKALPGGSSAQILGKLVLEGLLARDMFYLEGRTQTEGIRFAYERLSDHLIVEHILHRHCNPQDVKNSFGQDTVLGKLVRSARDRWKFQSRLEAFAVQLPERFGFELLEVISQEEQDHSHVEAFLDSLIWRHSDSVSTTAINLIQKNLDRKQPEIIQQILPVLLHVAPRPKHPLNADMLHQFLWPLGLAERDWLWSIAIHHDWERSGPTSRLVSWAWDEHGHPQLDDAVVDLTGTALAWMLTSSNRYIRDRSTKALVALFQERLSGLVRLLKRFNKVNDPYVLERVFAAAYACVLRSNDLQGRCDLARFVLSEILVKDVVPTHILVRDYARGIITASHLDIPESHILPPFESSWPATLPTLDELNPAFDDNSSECLGKLAGRIQFSVISWDWGTYIIRSNQWSVRRLADGRPLNSLASAKSRLKEFADSLTPKHRRLFSIYLNGDKKPAQSSTENNDRSLAKKRFVGSMGIKKRSQFEEIIDPLIHACNMNKYTNRWEEPTFPEELIKRFILNWVSKSGWNGEWFDDFDQEISRDFMRDEHKPERIGKKYQWIAYHEALARLSDNFVYLGDAWQGQDYRGPWQVTRRDIDPSVLLRQTYHTGWESAEKTWWNSVQPHFQKNLTDDQWLQSEVDIPNARDLIMIVNPHDNDAWLTLDVSTHVQQHSPPGEEEMDIKRRRIWWGVDSYIINAKDVNTIVEWANARKVAYFDNPDSSVPLHMFYGEYPGQMQWFGMNESGNYEDDDAISSSELPVGFQRTSMTYSRADSGYDCSLEESVNIRIPSPHILKRFSLGNRRADGEWLGPEGQVVAFDPSVKSPGPSALLMRRKILEDGLQKQNAALVWLIRGEKQMIGKGISHEDWRGRLLFQGAFVLQQGKMLGAMRTWFDGPGVQLKG